MVSPEPPLIGAIDQGTTGTRFVVFDAGGVPIGDGFVAHERHLSPPNRVEYDPTEIWECTRAAIQDGLDRAGIDPADLSAIGVANQRQTTVVWDEDGEPVAPAQSWQDRRAECTITKLGDTERDLITERTGLAIDPYFAGPKLAWLLEHETYRGRSLRDAAAAGRVHFGTIDAWLLSKLTGRHRTDVTNAAQTSFFDPDSMAWDEELLSVWNVPAGMLPRVAPSSHPDAFGRTDVGGLLEVEIPVTGVLGNQQAALVGQGGFEPGSTKVSYGSGNFALQHVGTRRIEDAPGLLSTVWFQRAGTDPLYGIEGPVLTTGTALEWLEQVGLVDEHDGLVGGEDADTLAPKPVVVPSIGGQGAPNWGASRGGSIIGFTRFTDPSDLVLATIDGIGFGTRAVLDAIEDASELPVRDIFIDGGAIEDDAFAARQATLLDRRLLRGQVVQTSALGASRAAGLATGIWAGLSEFAPRVEDRFEPADSGAIETRYEEWCTIATGWQSGG